jgi:hypothetical protein
MASHTPSSNSPTACRESPCSFTAGPGERGAPAAGRLHFHLRGLDGRPTCSREILHISGLSASPETHLALLHVMPHWSRGRRRILRDMIVARWIRSMEVSGGCSAFKAESAAYQVMRWARICEHLKGIPRVNFHPPGSSAGF